MSIEPRTITLATSDHGDVTLPCPAWCVGHSHHDPRTQRVDLIHSGPTVDLNFRHTTVLSVQLVQSPFASPGPPHLGGRTPGASTYPVGDTLSPAQLYTLAAALDQYADRLRDLAARLDAILGGGQ